MFHKKITEYDNFKKKIKKAEPCQKYYDLFTYRKEDTLLVHIKSEIDQSNLSKDEKDSLYRQILELRVVAINGAIQLTYRRQKSFNVPQSGKNTDDQLQQELKLNKASLETQIDEYSCLPSFCHIL